MWSVLFHDEFEAEFAALSAPVQDELLARLLLLREFGPQLGRPHVDTLKGSAHANMKELRFDCEGVWRFAFAFDPKRRAIVLCGGDKKGVNQRRFYTLLVEKADRRFSKIVKDLRS